MVNLERQASALSLPAMASPNLHLPCGCLAQDYTYALTLGWLAVSESSSMLATGGSVAAAKSGAEAAAGEAPPPLPGQDSRVQDLLRSGKQNFSVSESRAVANFLARKAKQDDLLILCGKG